MGHDYAWGRLFLGVEPPSQHGAVARLEFDCLSRGWHFGRVNYKVAK